MANQFQNQNLVLSDTDGLPLISHKDLYESYSATVSNNNKKQLALALAGYVYDVSSRPDLYGTNNDREVNSNKDLSKRRDGAYSLFSGKVATRCFAKMSLEQVDVGRSDLKDLIMIDSKESSDKSNHGSVGLLNLPKQRAKALLDWIAKFDKQYPKIGRVEEEIDIGYDGKTSDVVQLLQGQECRDVIVTGLKKIVERFDSSQEQESQKKSSTSSQNVGVAADSYYQTNTVKSSMVGNNADKNKSESKSESNGFTLASFLRCLPIQSICSEKLKDKEDDSEQTQTESSSESPFLYYVDPINLRNLKFGATVTNSNTLSLPQCDRKFAIKPKESQCQLPLAFILPNFLSPNECQSLRQLVLKAYEGRPFSSKLRLGVGGLQQQQTGKEFESNLLKDIEERIGKLVNCPPHNEEDELMAMVTVPETVISDQSSHQYLHIGAHVDVCKRVRRFATAIIYLSDVQDGCGGETAFLQNIEGVGQELLDKGIVHTDEINDDSDDEDNSTVLGNLKKRFLSIGPSKNKFSIAVKPREGSCLVFYTRRASTSNSISSRESTVDSNSWHGGLRVTRPTTGGSATGTQSAAAAPTLKFTLQKFKEIPVNVWESKELDENHGVKSFLRDSEKTAIAGFEYVDMETLK